MIKRAFKRSERGQVIMLMVILLAALLGIVGLAVDGGRLYLGQRTAQNAADNAALAGSLALCDGSSVTTIAFAAASINGFNNDGVTNSVTVNNPPSTGPNAGDLEHVEVIITSVQEPAFSQLVYSGDLESTVRAVASCDLQLAFEHALFAGATSCTNSIAWGSSNVNIIGGVHTNGNLLMSGSNNYIDGNVTYADQINGTDGNVTYNPPAPDNPLPADVQDYPVPYQMDDYIPGGTIMLEADALGQYYYLDGDINVAWLEAQGLYDSSGGVLADGLYYATGHDHH